MTDTLVLFLPGGAAPMRWLRVAGEAVTARGEGLPPIDPEHAGATVAVAPADTVTLHWAELPDRSLPQAIAAAKLLVAEASVTPPGELHVAVGREPDSPDRPIGVVAAAQMRAWLDALAADGIDPAAVIPAPMLLPRPAEGFVRADLGGGSVVRGTASGFADEVPLTDLVTGGVAPATLGRDAIEAAIAAAVAAPALDLRQGAFARRSRRAIDWALVKRLAWLGAAIVGVTLAISLAEIVKRNVAASDMEARTEALARAALPRGETVDNADRQLDERLGRMRGAGLGFARTAAAVFAAVRAVPGTELRGVGFDGNGKLRATIAAPGEGQVIDVRTRLEGQGFTVQLGTLTAAGGTVSGDLTVGA